MSKIHIAIAGNPNCGKTTLFNALTGSRQHVGNWPGVTVERVEGNYRHAGTRVHVTDLPGIYSFSAFSIDETVAREHILQDRPEVVVNILDASNLERNLYLTTQLLEMRVPVVVALSMVDVAKRRRIRIEVEHLARHLGCPVVPVVVAKGTGLDELRDAIASVAASRAVAETRIRYDSELESAIKIIGEAIGHDDSANDADPRWLAIQLLEKDAITATLAARADLKPLLDSEVQRVEAHTGEDLDIVFADGRYGFIHGLARDVVHRDGELRTTLSNTIDNVLINRVLGIPLFLGIMYLVFVITINLGGPFIDFFDMLCGTIFVDGFRALLTLCHMPEGVIALLANGIGGGIQAVSTFIPPIFLIFLCLAFLEDSGYMSRAAFVMDRFLRTIGLPGKAFIPMLVGFGCNVPAILATRTLENNRDRILTILMNPFMSCGARLPVYALFVAAFFPHHGGTVLFGIYITGVVLAVLTGLLFKKTILKGEVSSFVMELPPYHLPTFHGVMFHTWNRLRSFIIKAGRVILVVVVILSFFNSIGTDGGFGKEDSGESVLSKVSKGVAPVFYPMGLTEENWPGAVGLFMGLFAKEAVVGTLDTLYAQIALQEAGVVEQAEEPEPFEFWRGIGAAFAAIPAGFEGFFASLGDPVGLGIGDERGDAATVADDIDVDVGTVHAMTRYFDGQVGALAYMLFILIYAPCVAAIAAIYRETNLNWTLFAVVYLTSLAWITSTLFYQIGTYAQHPASSAAWIAVALAALLTMFIGLKIRSRTLTIQA